MVRFVSIVFLVSIISSVGHTQNATLIGGADTETCAKVLYVPNNQVFVVGITESYGAGNEDGYMVIMDTLGNVSITHTFGTGDRDRVRDVESTADGNLILGGNTKDGTFKGFILKCDLTGNTIWTSFMGSVTFPETIWRVLELSDGSIMGLGWDVGDIYMVKLNAAGTFQWDQTLGFNFVDRGHDIIQAANGDLIICGRGTISFSEQMFVVRMDVNGNILWQQALGGLGNEYGNAIAATPDGGFLVGGFTASSGAGGNDFLLVKYDNTDAIEWSKTYGGTGNEEINDIKVMSDGSYLLAGTTDSYGIGGDDYLMIKTDNLGVVDWAMSYGGSGDEQLGGIDVTPGGGLILAGSSGSWAARDDFLVVKTDLNGDAPCYSQVVTPTVSDVVLAVETGIVVKFNHAALTGTLTLSGGFMSATDNACTALPVDLTSFNASCTDERVLVQWTTATETNNDYFEVQQSVDGVAFETVAVVPGAGNSVVSRQYQWFDKARDELTYYRLKQVDYNGNQEVFSTVAVSPCQVGQVTSTINPHSNMLSIHIPTPLRQQKLSVVLYNGLGQKIAERHFSNTHDNELFITAVPKGVVLVQVFGEKEMFYSGKAFNP